MIKLLRVLFVLLPLASLVGCPQLLDDDFVTASGQADASTGGSSGDGSVEGSSGSGGSDGGDADPCASCTSNETCCDGVCADTTSSSRHCGGCNQGCPGTACVSGNCTSTCVLPFLDCDQNVVTGCEVNAATDVDNCGGCGSACAFDASCEGGICKCPAGSANCNGEASDGCETDISSSTSNCGACGKSCGPNQSCEQGACACVSGFADCNQDADDGCEANLSTSSTHCGNCDQGCGENGACQSGTCGCLTGFLDCNAQPGCESSLTSPGTCGGCTTVCSAPTPVCDGQGCVSSCSGGLTQCGASCVALATDPEHCGACNSPVGPSQACVGGQRVCLAGFGDCNGSASDGCETDVTSSPLHCGSCNGACKPGAVCSASTCQCAAGTPQDCGAACRQCCSSSDCSDGDPCTENVCNSSGVCTFGASCAGGGKCCAGLGCFECCASTDCSGGQVCSNQQCVTPSCANPQILCSGQCVDASTNPKHCGGCGTDCGVGRTCVQGSCTPKWVTMATPSLPARSHAAFTFIPSLGKVFVWGGIGAASQLLTDGALYEPSTNSWSLISTQGAPSGRALATAVWTGTSVVVWGGGNVQGNADFNDGGRYDPLTNSWTPLPSTGAPAARRAAFGVWTGSRVLFVGGFTGSAPTPASSQIHLYDPQTGAWTQGSSTAEPPSLLHPSIAFAAGDLHVYGGRPGGNGQAHDYYRYRVGDDAWAKLANGPNQRHSALGVHDGASFVVWGGRMNQSLLANGKRTNPASQWVDLATAPAGFGARAAPWREHGHAVRVASSTVLLVGGVNTTGVVQKQAALCNTATDTWTELPAFGPHEHLFGVGVWTGSEFVLWGGLSAAPVAPTNTGVRLRP